MNISRRMALQGIAGFTGFAGLGLNGPALAQQFKVKLTTTASNDLDTKWLELLKAGIESGSGGKISANIYPASQLGSAETTIEGVTMGTVEVAINASGVYEGLAPRTAVFSVPGVIKNMAQGAKVMADPDVRKMLSTIARDKGVEVITALAHSPVGIVSHKPIKSLADFKGLKIRVPGSKLLIEQMKQVGASPVAMSLGEVLPAFQNGTIDGVFAGSTIFTALKYYDISKNLTLLPSTFIVIVGLVSSSFMSSLGPLETVVRDQARKADAEGAVWGEADVSRSTGEWEKNGGLVNNLSEVEAQKFLDIVVPVAIKNLDAATQADYAVLKAASAKYS